MYKIVGILLSVFSLFVTVNLKAEEEKPICFKPGVMCTANSMDEFEAILAKTGQKIYVDVYSTYCPPCRKLAPEFEKWAKKNYSKAKFVKINSSNVPKVVSKYNKKKII